MKNNEDKLYLAKRVELRQTPVELPTSADNVRTIKEVMEYFGIINKEYIIHIVIERIELKELKEELSDEDPVDVKKEKIKKEADTKLIPRTESSSWRILKFKRPPTTESEPHTAESHKRAHSGTDDSFDRAAEELDQAFAETDTLLQSQPSTPKEKEKEKKKGKEKDTTSLEEEESWEKNKDKTQKLFYSPPALRIKKKKKNIA